MWEKFKPNDALKNSRGFDGKQLSGGNFMRATSSNIGQLLYKTGVGKETAKKFSPMIIKKVKGWPQILSMQRILNVIGSDSGEIYAPGDC